MPKVGGQSQCYNLSSWILTPLPAYTGLMMNRGRKREREREREKERERGRERDRERNKERERKKVIERRTNLNNPFAES